VRKRFRHFVNSEAGDANVVFVEERGQIRPATLDERSNKRPVRIPVVAEAA
jgi:nitrite reductase (NADH) large subunit